MTRLNLRSNLFPVSLKNEIRFVRLIEISQFASMDAVERITIDPRICGGKPTVRGLRYPVSFILELLASGMSLEQILADYEDLQREDIVACLEFAAV
jgi:uncharacterized protein (DUF433 family)